MKPIIAFLFLLLATPATAQFGKLLKKIEKANQDAERSIVTGARTLRNAQYLLQLVDEAKRTTAQFNETVKVSKGETSPAGTKGLEEFKIRQDKIKGLTWAPTVYHGEDVFPSAILGLSGYSGPLTKELEAISRPVGFRFVSSRQNVAIRWEIECTDKRFFDRLSGLIDYHQADQEIYVMPEIPWNFAHLAANVSPTPIKLHFRVYDEEEQYLEESKTVTVRSINDCLFRYDQTDLSFLFTAFVQETHPEIDAILAEALATEHTSSFAGYQGSETAVLAQLAAIWHALHDRGIKYSSGTTPSHSNNAKVSSQQVRTFANAIKYQQANCVDGTVVFSSILRRIGLNAGFVLVPGHCYLVFSLDREGKNIRFLETTLLSDDRYLRTLEEPTPETTRAAMLKQFHRALYAGKTAFEKASAAGTARVVALQKSRDLVTSIPY